MVNLDIPFLPQYDNEHNPNGSCNVTSIAMCLSYWGIKGDGSYPQLEDQLYSYMSDNHLSRHSPYDLKLVVESKGLIDNYRTDRSIKELIFHLDKGRPLVIHGYFTRFGHIVCCKGYNNDGLIIHDPWGRWTPYGYDFSHSGKDVIYTYADIEATCCDPGIPGSIWSHSIYPEGK